MKLILSGCAPVPLASYLKALGVLRLLCEQHLESISGHWSLGQFALTTNQSSEEVLDFFLNGYVPTSLVVPWSGNDFFAVKRDAKAGVFDKCPTSNRIIEAVMTSETPRLDEYRRTIRETLAAMDASDVPDKKAIEGNGGPQRQAKSRLLQALRSRLPESAVAWIDSAAVIESEAPAFNALLGGGGGSDGNSHFSDNFMQSLWMTLPDFESHRSKPLMATGGSPFDSRAALAESLFGTIGTGTRISDLSPVLFDSTKVGGPNQKSGFEAKAGSNPWDFIFMLEGALLFAGALGRKLDDDREPSARFPFLFSASPVGAGSSYFGESSGRELWLPIWERPTTIQELKAVFAEGRVEKHGRMARVGTDAFVAIAQHGVARGISAFQRIGFFKGRIGGDNYFTAVDQGFLRCTRNDAVDLLKDIEPWVDRLRQAVKGDRCPGSVRTIFVEVEQRTAALALDGSGDRIQDLLVSLGRLERALAKSLRWTLEETYHLRPIQGLRPDWLTRCSSGTAEFRLAAALAGTRGSLGKETLWLRQHLEPLEMGATGERSWTKWDATPGNDVVWHEGDLTDALNAILGRRMIRVEKSGARGWPDISPRTASLDDITQFIEGRTDDALLADLLWGLSLIDWEKIVRDERRARKDGSAKSEAWKPFGDEEHRAVPSSLYALLRLCFREKAGEDKAIPLVPAIHLRAARGQGEAASEIAARRLLGSGYAPLVRGIPLDGAPARRTAAALLFPISSRDFRLLEKTILHQTETNNP